ncbi:MAG TPA: SelB C-terminal domain-containing protein, partial [Phycisphaerae bacterium]|nr:SelB C-terminal domain-containing protein [Phycisphaerae bacterium]
TAQWTVGGGEVVRPVSRRMRLKDAEVVASMRHAASEDSRERLEGALRRAGFEARANLRLACEIGIEPAMVETLRRDMEKSGRMISVGAGMVHVDALRAMEDRAMAYLNRHHGSKPVEPGISRDRFVGWIDARTGAGFGKEICARLESRGAVVVRGPYVAHADFRPAMSVEDADAMACIVEEITRAGFDPPVWNSLKSVALLSKSRAKTLEDSAKTDSRLVAFAPGAYISRESLTEFERAIRALGVGGRRFKLAEVRDKLNLSRRVVQPLLEHLDRVRLTKRVGDERILMEPGR